MLYFFHVAAMVALYNEIHTQHHEKNLIPFTIPFYGNSIENRLSKGIEQLHTPAPACQPGNDWHITQNPATKCFIVNDVENGVLVNNEKNIIADVIRRLLSTTIVYTKDNCIHVSANLSGNTTWLNINTNDSRQNWAISNSLRQVQSMTEKIGGCVTVINNKLSGITLAFAFSNQKQAA